MDFHKSQSWDRTGVHHVAIEERHPPLIYPKHAEITVYRSETGPDGKPALPKNVEMDGIDTDASSPVPMSEVPKLVAAFIHESVYSPVRLANELGWEPTPRGYSPPESFALDGTSPLDALCLPTHTDQKPIFGWVDAFEDLMRVNSGLELSDLDTKHAKVHHLWRLFLVLKPSMEPHPRLRHVRNMTFHMNMCANNSWYLWFPSLAPGLMIKKSTPVTLEEWVTARKREKETMESLDELTERRKGLKKLLSMDLDNIAKAHGARGLRPATSDLLALLAADKDGSSFSRATTLALSLMHYQLHKQNLFEPEASFQAQTEAEKPNSVEAHHAMLSLITLYTRHPMGAGRDVQLLRDQGRILKSEAAEMRFQGGEGSYTDWQIRDFLGTVHRHTSISLNDANPHRPAFNYLCEQFSTKKMTLKEGEARYARRLQETVPEAMDIIQRLCK
ncbi:hypothetical protein QBC41DRAFT_303218 [Cercophora samala]|uniref:Uncharacterized protein n=1 Tax=Cercophora samala TaxID=330535 RepID=A0AA39ZCZ9_9PEZI|nr:hypothetical protein QBC41DRAFT_303218 [Cercophora samala]